MIVCERGWYLHRAIIELHAHTHRSHNVMSHLPHVAQLHTTLCAHRTLGHTHNVLDGEHSAVHIHKRLG